MLSLGIDASRAFCTMVRRVGFASMSPPPSRAATSICRARRAKSLPRAASAAPFWCLIECHLEWPLMDSLSLLVQLVDEALMETEITGQLGVEARHPDGSLPQEHRHAVVRREHL